MDKTLNVNDPKQVSSPKMLDIFLGIPQYHLLIYTGIAIPESVINSDDPDDTIHDRIAINFGHPIDRNGRPITITGLINYTATVGLASFGNDTTDFLFATDDVAVSLLNGELELVSNIAVLGDSVLHRFSYQANVIVDVDEPLISGIISWTQETAQIASPTRNDNLFTITAFIQLPGAGPFGGGPQQDVAWGEVTGTLIEQNGRISVPYVIRNVPLNTSVYVKIVTQPGAFLPPPRINLPVSQVSGQRPITLILTHMKEPNVNFEMGVFQGPN